MPRTGRCCSRPPSSPTASLIWYAQVVIYTLFHRVGDAEYMAYHNDYSARIPFPVVVPGFASFLLPLALLFLRPASVDGWMVVANAACGFVSLFVTVALEIPRHSRLQKGGKQDDVIRQLVAFNWPRTLALTGSAILSYAMVLCAYWPI